MELSGAALAALLAGLAWLLWLWLWLAAARRRGGRLPPGPAPLPLLGNLPQLDPRALHRSLEKLSQRYGPVYTIHLGSLPCVVLYGYQAVKEALVDQADDFSDRGDFPVFYRFTQGNGIAFSSGQKWKVLRRFALQTLKNFGMGRSSIEERIQEEAQCLVKEFQKTNGAPFNPINLVCRAVSNVICSVVFGNRFDYEDADFLTLLNHLNDNFRIMSSMWGELYNIFPRLMDFLPGPHQQIFRNFEKLRQFIAERVRRHQQSLDPKAPRDFIDCFLIRMEQEKQDPLSHFHTETLVMTTHNLFFGGTETTSTTLRYSFLILMKYPEVAAQVYEEIDQVIGRERAPCLADRKLMPYTDAVIYEIQRFITILPMGLPRAVTRDTPFRDFLLPKGTNVIPLLSSVHYDPSQFKDPNSFNPANFLDENNSFKSSDAFMPFAPGKRICLGAGLARMEIFLFLTTLLQHFTFRPLVAPAEIDLTPQCTGLGNVPRPFQFQVFSR
ncbi:cytochrome P450 2F5-like [Eublepharis macularius]|uniref:Cytochrome P450 2F5-like n=1 Tax=Eublepharis macularius TaxID=481883 RepID=A0AA97KFV2_EUBMA|nr:cytochrome P450 2F5-like [Eublepharis macularius]